MIKVEKKKKQTIVLHLQYTLLRSAPWGRHSSTTSLQQQNMRSNGLLMEGFQRSFFTGNWPSARGHKSDLIFASRMSAKMTSEQWTYLISRVGKTLPTITHDGHRYYIEGWSEEKRSGDLLPGRSMLKGKETTWLRFTCIGCYQDCHSCVGLYSHNRYYADISS